MADNKNTPKPKPSIKVETPEVEVEEVIVPAVEVEEEVVVAATPAYTEKVEEPVIVSAPASVSKAPATKYAVVSGDSVDTVFVSKVVVHNRAQKKSLSVHHVQRRLSEWGFVGAFLDRDGYCGDNTVTALTEFQALAKLPETGKPDYQTLSALFEGDTNVKLVH